MQQLSELAKVFITDEHIKKIKQLIEAISNADIKRKFHSISDKQDFNLLLRNAVFYQQIEIVRYLLAEMPGVNVNCQGVESGKTPLIIACENGWQTIAELLVEQCAFVNAVDAKGLSPVYYALTHSHFTLVNFLLSKGGVLYFPDESQMPQINITALPDAQKLIARNTLEKIQRQGELIDRRPSFQNTFLCAYVLYDNLAFMNNSGSVNNAASRIDNLPIIAFLARNNITLLTRTKLLSLAAHYKDVALNEFTAALAKHLTNNNSVLLPFAMNELPSIQNLVSVCESLSHKTDNGIELKVFENTAAKQFTTSLIRWELKVAENLNLREPLRQFAKKCQAVVMQESAAVKYLFTQVTGEAVNILKQVEAELTLPANLSPQ